MLRISAVTVALVVAICAPAFADPGYHQPAVGTCHDYSFAGASGDSETSLPVDCAGPHREVTVAVPQLPAGVPYKRALRAVGPSCFRALAETLGGSRETRAASAYDLLYFRPTKAERAQGARWLRCDLALSGGRVQLPLPEPLLSDPLPRSLLRCLLGGKGHVSTTCDRPHRFRQTGVVTLTGAYPGHRRLTRIARRQCRRRAPAGAYYRWLFPFPPQWRAGEKYVVCFTESRA